MNYRFNGTDYTEDQMTKVADVKGYTLEELISEMVKEDLNEAKKEYLLKNKGFLVSSPKES